MYKDLMEIFKVSMYDNHIYKVIYDLSVDLYTWMTLIGQMNITELLFLINSPYHQMIKVCMAFQFTL